MNPVKELTRNLTTPICGKKVTRSLSRRCTQYNPTECTWRCDKAEEEFNWQNYLGDDDYEEMAYLENSRKRMKDLNVNMDREEWI